ncbi:MAG: hypothetical protein M0008_08310 [Actinomycetota bacterium]|nr:hypothetical protein [Actinomycetota bacterium]
MPSPEWAVYFYQRLNGTVPGEEFLVNCPTSVEAHFSRLLEVVAAGPPPMFQGGGFWEAMHGDMAGYHEARKPGKFPGGQRANFRLFCILDRTPPGLPTAALVVLTGLWKPLRKAFRDQDYAAVRAIGDEYLATVPRRVAR